MFRFYPSAAAEIPIALACDPAVTACNAPAALVEYLRTGDPGNLRIPPGAALAVLRPLTPEDMARARDDAGRRPVLGDFVFRRIEEDREALGHDRTALDAEAEAEKHLETARVARASAAGVDDPYDLDAQAELAEARADSAREAARAARAAALARRVRLRDEMDDQEAQALVARARWYEAFSRAVVKRALLFLPVEDASTGQPVPREEFAADPLRWLDLVDPPDLRLELLSELWIHADRLAGLSAEGKARCAARPGSGPT